MKVIQLIHGGEAIVSDEDYSRLAVHKWRAIESKPGYVYACRNEPKTGARIRMHREVCAARRGQVVDHINGNTLDNRRENLRAVTYAQNSQNITRPTRSSSGYRNVYRQGSGYIVRAYRDGKRIYCGWHATLEAAVEARDMSVAPTERSWRAAA